MSLLARLKALDSTDRSKAAFDAAVRVSEVASSGAPLPDAVRVVVQTALELLRGEQSSLMMLDGSGSSLELMAVAGNPPGAPLGHRVGASEGIAGRVLATGRAMRVENVDHTAFVNFVPKGRAIASSVVAPLRARGRPIGVLSVSTSEGGTPFDDEDVRLAQIFADQAAGLIQRTRLHEQAERRSADLAALLDSSQKLLGTLDIDALLQAVLDGATSLVAASDGIVCLIDPATKTVTRGVFRGFDKTRIRAISTLPEVVDAVEKVSLRELKHEGREYIVLGLRSTQGTSGLIVVPVESDLARDRAPLLQAFGQQCASAIGSAEIHSLMQQKESQLSATIHSVPNPIVLVDSARRIVSINPSAEQLFGVSTVFSSGAEVRGTLGHQELEDLLTRDGDLSTEVEMGVPARSFKVRTKDVSLPGAPGGRLLIMDDVTAEREMVQTQHDFVAMIGHELRTPLTVVKGFTKMLLRQLQKGPLGDVEEALQIIDTKTAHLERLIEDLLYVSRIEAREATLRMEPVDLRRLTHDIATELLAEHRDRKITLEAPAQLVWPSDETKISLVLRHLMENALKYSEAPDPVVVRITERGDEVHIEVVDRGIGIVSSDVPHLFERFRQLDGSSTREHGGTGVGLYLCAQLIKVLDGRIWVDSTWGKGSTFSLALPSRAVIAPVIDLESSKSSRASS